MNDLWLNLHLESILKFVGVITIAIIVKRSIENDKELVITSVPEYFGSKQVQTFLYSHNCV